MPPKRTPTVPDIEVAENQPAAATLDAALARFEGRILEVLTSRLDPIVATLDAHSARLDAQQETLNRLVTRLDDRNSPSPSEDLDDPTPTIGRRERTSSAQRERTPSARSTNTKDHHYMPFVPSRHETWAPTRPFPPSGADGTIPPPPVGTPAPSFGSSNPFADDLAHYLAPLQHRTIRDYVPCGGPPGGGEWWHRHHGGPMMLAGLTDRPAKYSGEAGENAEFWFHQLDHYFNANGVTNEDIKGDNLLGFLTGEAPVSTSTPCGLTTVSP